MDLARQFKNSKEIGIGAVDCEKEAALCQKQGVNGYPSIKAIVMGKGKSYNGGREAEPMKNFITNIAANKGTKGGSTKCRPGMFKSKMKHAVVGLCESHFPDAKAKNDWLIFYYDHSATAEMRDGVNTAAMELGNYPPDVNKASKKAVKVRERIQGLADKHGLKASLPAKGPFGMDEIVKVGAVCCDCDDEHKAFCANSLKEGEEDLKTPQVYWVTKGKRIRLKDVELTSKGLAGAALQKLGHVKEEKAEL